MASALHTADAVETPMLEPGGTYKFPSDVDGVRVKVEWTSKQQGIICDLDLNTFFYDERARFYEKVDTTCRRSKDESTFLIKDDSEYNRSHQEFLKLDFQLVKPETSAIVLFLDGGPRNFQYLQSVSIDCNRVIAERHYNSFLPKEIEEGNKNGPLFQAIGRTKKSYKGLVMCIFYKDGWDALTERPIWVMKLFLEPVYVSSIKDKQEKCTQLVIQAVPSLEKFRPRLFSSIRDICAALSSHSLPKLKKKFQRSEEGLHIGQFTEVIFKQLYETHPRILEESEAPYAVAMLQEMFQQIDYNGDGGTNWDEFTTFCVQTGLTNTRGAGRGGGGGAAGAGKAGTVAAGEGGFSLEQYVIEYGEEVLQRDHVLSAYRFVTQMRHVPETRRILLIPEDSDNILILDEKFRLHCQLYPSKVQVIGTLSKRIENIDEKKDKKGLKGGGGKGKGGDRGGGGAGGGGGGSGSATNPMGGGSSSNAPRALVYDIVYLTGRDLYAYTSSDHSITICKELSSVNGVKVSFLQHNRFYHNLLHLKLCWSEKHDLLCSTASDRVIYGWNIDTSAILFQISRHSDIITDFIAVDPLDLFITCSMDKRIVMWSAISRRVKGVLLGHKRGVRSLSVYENSLLSAGFECDAKVWDLSTKDCVAILKGHRHPIVAAKLMCEKATTEKEHRAITVDESGEFRLWNIYIREKGSEPIPVPTIQIFEMQNPESPLNQFRFLALPYNARSSTSYYSNLIACSTKLLHFIPEKNTKEFIPPTAFVCHESGAALITAIGKNVLVYNLATGEFDQIFESVTTHDIVSICMDGERGRRMFLGTSSGEVFLVNSTNGTVIDKVHYHSKEITSIVQRKGIRTALFSSSMDGHLHVYEESSGKIHLQNAMDSLLGDGLGLASLKLAPSIQALVAVSAGTVWGLLNDTTYKKLLIVHETEVITAVEVIGASRDKWEEEVLLQQQRGVVGSGGGQTHSQSTAASTSSPSSQPLPTSSLKEHLLTLAVAMTQHIAVYVLDTQDLKGCKAFELSYDYPVYITDLLVMKAGDNHAINYSSIRNASQPGGELGAQQLLATTDDGRLLIWNLGQLRSIGEDRFRTYYKQSSSTSRQRKHGRTKKSMSMEGNSIGGGGGGGGGGRRGSMMGMATGSSGHLPPLTPSHSGSSSNTAMANSLLGMPSTPLFLTGVDLMISEEDRLQEEANGGVSSPLSTKGGQSSPSRHAILNTSQASWLEATSKEIFPVTAAFKSGTSPAPFSPPPLSRQPSKASVNANGAPASPTRSSMFASPLIHSSTLAASLYYLPIDRSWMAHSDTIHGVVPLASHGCFVTVSHDGYHRVWNLDAECLGELILPNITEAMKQQAMCKEPGSQWRFILERIPITKHHIDIANVLTKALRATRQDRLLEHQNSSADRARHFIPFGFKGFREASDEEDHPVEEEKDQLRRTVLRSLTEPPKFSEEPPPTRLPTKEEKELIKLAFGLTGAAAGGSPVGSRVGSRAGSPSHSRRPGATAAPLQESSFVSSLSLAGPSTATASMSLTEKSVASTLRAMKQSQSMVRKRAASNALSPSPANSPVHAMRRNGPRGAGDASAGGSTDPHEASADLQENSLRSSLLFNGDSSVCLSSFGVPSLWYVPGEKDVFGKSVASHSKDAPVVTVPPAFSEASIASLHREGLIDVEGHRILRSIASKSDRVQVYDRSQPTLLIRSPSMSASVQLPALDSVRKTEISFGAQKDMYKNAERLLNERDSTSKTAIRNAVAMSRVEANVRRVQTMVHLIQPPTHDEVILPKASATSGEALEEGGDPSNPFNRSEDARMQLRLLRSAALVPPEALQQQRPLDRASIDKWISKMTAALDIASTSSHPNGGLPGGLAAGRSSPSRGHSRAVRGGTASSGDLLKKKKLRKREVLSQAAITALEHKLYLAIRGEYRNRMAIMVRRKQAALTAAQRAMTPAESAEEAEKQMSTAVNTLGSMVAVRPGSPGGGAGAAPEPGKGGSPSLTQELVRLGTDDDNDDFLAPSTGGGGGGPGTAHSSSPSAFSPAANAPHPLSPGGPSSSSQSGPAPGLSVASPSKESSTGGAGVAVGGQSPKRPGTLTTRMLLPYYKLENVHQFMDIFAKVDENFSGDLDVNEWIRLFTSLNETVPVQEARMIFMKIDKDGDGYLSMRELIPVVFNKASKEQQKLIIQYAEMELTKKAVTETVPKVSITDLEFLFEAYDLDNVGFVDIAYIKDRIRNFGLSEQQLYFFLELIAEMADDDMVNLTEFKRMFKPFLASNSRGGTAGTN